MVKVMTLTILAVAVEEEVEKEVVVIMTMMMMMTIMTTVMMIVIVMIMMVMMMVMVAAMTMIMGIDVKWVRALRDGQACRALGVRGGGTQGRREWLGGRIHAMVSMNRSCCRDEDCNLRVSRLLSRPRLAASNGPSVLTSGSTGTARRPSTWRCINIQNAVGKVNSQVIPVSLRGCLVHCPHHDQRR